MQATNEEALAGAANRATHQIMITLAAAALAPLFVVAVLESGWMREPLAAMLPDALAAALPGARTLDGAAMLAWMSVCYTLALMSVSAVVPRILAEIEQACAATLGGGGDAGPRAARIATRLRRLVLTACAAGAALGLSTILAASPFGVVGIPYPAAAAVLCLTCAGHTALRMRNPLDFDVGCALLRTWMGTTLFGSRPPGRIALADAAQLLTDRRGTAYLAALHDAGYIDLAGPRAEASLAAILGRACADGVVSREMNTLVARDALVAYRHARQAHPEPA